MKILLKIFEPLWRGAIQTLDPFSIAAIGSAVAGAGHVGGAVISADNAANINRENQQFARETAASNQGFAREGMRYNREERIAQERFQEHMSSTAYQRAMDDARRAGLNPILTAAGGAASAPTGAAGSAMGANAPGSTSVTNDAGGGLGRATSNAAQLAALDKELEAKDAAINLDKAATVAKITESQKNEVTAKGVALENTALTSQLPTIAAQAEKDKGQANWDKSALTWDNIVGRGGTLIDMVKGIIGTSSSAKGLIDTLTGQKKGTPLTGPDGRKIYRHGNTNYYPPKH